MICWLPVVVCGVMELPEASDEETAGVPLGVPPLVTTKIWNAGVVVGAGTHWNAQPMFHVPPAMVNAGLVQLPVSWVAGTSTVAGPTTTGAVVAVVPAAAAPGAVVAVVPPAAVVVVVPPAGTVDVVDDADPATAVVDGEAAGGSLYPCELEELATPEGDPALPLIHIPTTSARAMATSSCHVLQARRSLIWSSPGWGW